MIKLSFLFGLIISSLTAFGQYEVKTVHRPDGITLNYFNPMQVASSDDYEAGLSLYKSINDNTFLLDLTVLFKYGITRELNGNLTIQTTGDRVISLSPVFSKIININGSDGATAMYSMSKKDIWDLETKSVKLISFNVSNEVIALTLSKNREILMKEFKILEKDNLKKHQNATDKNNLNGDEKPYEDYSKSSSSSKNTFSTMFHRNTSGVLGVNTSPNPNRKRLSSVYANDDYVKKTPGLSKKLSESGNKLNYNTDLGKSKYDKNLNWAADVNENDIQGSIDRFRNEQRNEEIASYMFWIGTTFAISFICFLIYKSVKKTKKDNTTLE